MTIRQRVAGKLGDRFRCWQVAEKRPTVMLSEAKHPCICLKRNAVIPRRGLPRGSARVEVCQVGSDDGAGRIGTKGLNQLDKAGP